MPNDVQYVSPMVSIPSDLKFNSFKYERLSVKNYIKKLNDYEVFVGIDFGDGVCTLYKAYLKSTVEVIDGVQTIKKKWVLEKINIPEISIDDGVPTSIVYTKNGILIGKGTENYDAVCHQFKVLPQDWTAVYNSREKREITKDFLSELWKKALAADASLRANPKKTMVMVGHPGGKNWADKSNREKYIKMLNESIPGYTIGVMAEPAAAIFGEIYNSIKEGKPINISAGVLVVEPGSSTTDTCYILPGLKPFTDSVACAGRDIDERIFDQIISDNKKELGLEEELFDEKSVRFAILKIKSFKEEYCNNPAPFDDSANQVAGERSITIIQKDPFNPQSKGSEKRIYFGMNRELLDKALRRKKTKNVSTGTVTIVWLDEIKEFLKVSKGCISSSNGKILCDKLILAGGTSKVPHFSELVKSVFEKEIAANKEFFHTSAESTQVVAKGLAFNKIYAKRFNELWENYENIVNYEAYRGMEFIAKKLSEVLAVLLIDCLKEFCQRYLNTPQDKRAKYGKAELNKEIIAIASKKKKPESFEEIFFKAFESRQEELKNTLSNLLNKTYGIADEASRVIDLSGLKSDLFEFTISSDNKYKGAVAAVIGSAFDNKWIFGSTLENMKYFFNWIDADFCKARLYEINDKNIYQKKVALCKEKIEALIKNEDVFRELMKDYFDVQAEIYLGKALFVVSD